MQHKDNDEFILRYTKIKTPLATNNQLRKTNFATSKNKIENEY